VLFTWFWFSCYWFSCWRVWYLVWNFLLWNSMWYKDEILMSYSVTGPCFWKCGASGQSRIEEVGKLFPFSFPFPFLPLPFPISFPYIPLPSFLELSPLKQLGSMGRAVSSPSGVWDRAPAEIEFGAFSSFIIIIIIFNRRNWQTAVTNKIQHPAATIIVSTNIKT